MHDRPVVLLLGASLFVIGVEASLQARPELKIVRSEDALVDLPGLIDAVQPDVIVFDSGESMVVTLPALLQLLPKGSHIPLIGMDLSANEEVTIFSTQQHPVIKSEDLVQAIHKVVSHGSE